MFDCLAPPGNCKTCLYTSFCFPCAAGDVARAVGGDWLLSCLCLPVCLLGPCIWCSDRRQLIRLHNLKEEPEACCVHLCTVTLCAPCAVCQELNQLQATTERGLQVTTQVVVQQLPTQMYITQAPPMVIQQTPYLRQPALY